VTTPSRGQPSATASAVSDEGSGEINRRSETMGVGVNERVASRLAKLEAAYEAQTVYVSVIIRMYRSHTNLCCSSSVKRNFA
jgi:hypothetical protein